MPLLDALIEAGAKHCADDHTALCPLTATLALSMDTLKGSGRGTGSHPCPPAACYPSKASELALL